MLDKHSLCTTSEKYLPMLDNSVSLKTMETRRIIVFYKVLSFFICILSLCGTAACDNVYKEEAPLLVTYSLVLFLM
jgi:hypothetical protein